MEKKMLIFTIMLFFLNDSVADGGVIPYTGHDIEIEVDYVKYTLFAESNTALANFPIRHRIPESTSYYYPKHIEVPETVEYNGEPFTVKYIMYQENCEMDYVSVPKSVTYLYLHTYSDSRNGYYEYIDTLHIPSFEVWFNLDFLYAPRYKHLLVGDSKEEVTDLTIPSGLGIVKGDYISCLHLFSITIPEDVTDLGRLDVMPELQHIYSYAETPPLLSKFFSASSNSPDQYYEQYIGYYKDITLHVPQAYIENYKSARPWNAIANIVPIEDGIVFPKAVGTVIEKDHVSYEVTDSAWRRVRVKGADLKATDGVLTIPEKVAYEGVSYEVVEISAQCFKGNDDLVTVSKLPESITVIGPEAFMNCKNLMKVERLPALLEKLGDDAFRDCASLCEFGLFWYGAYQQEKPTHLPQTLRPSDPPYSYTGVFSGCKDFDFFAASGESGEYEYFIGHYAERMFKDSGAKVSKVTRNVGKEAFSGCCYAPDLCLVCSEIGEKSFYGITSEVLTLDHISSSPVCNIGYLAFGMNLDTDDANRLRKIYCNFNEPPVCDERGVFDDEVYERSALIVPDNSVNAYKTATDWKRFKHIYAKSEYKDVVGISMPNNDQTKSSSAVYDLQGRRLNDKPMKGIYIQNGKKHVVVK